jgi:hypothetical protein
VDQPYPALHIFLAEFHILLENLMTYIQMHFIIQLKSAFLDAFFRERKTGSYPDCARSDLISLKPFNEFMGLNEAVTENSVPRTGFY